MSDVLTMARDLVEMESSLQAGREELVTLSAQRAEREASLLDLVTEIEAHRAILSELREELERRKGEVMAGDAHHRPGQIEQWDTFEALERLEKMLRGESASLEKLSQQGNETAAVMTLWLSEHAESVMKIHQRLRPTYQGVRILR